MVIFVKLIHLYSHILKMPKLKSEEKDAVQEAEYCGKDSTAAHLITIFECFFQPGASENFSEDNLKSHGTAPTP